MFRFVLVVNIVHPSGGLDFGDMVIFLLVWITFGIIAFLSLVIASQDPLVEALNVAHDHHDLQGRYGSLEEIQIQV